MLQKIYYKQSTFKHFSHEKYVLVNLMVKIVRFRHGRAFLKIPIWWNPLIFVDPWSLFTMKNRLIICLHWTSVVRVFHQMSDETGNSDSEGFGMDDRNFFDDLLVGFEVKGQSGVVFFNDDPGGLFDGVWSNTTHIRGF